MDITGLLASLESSFPATSIRNSLYLFPLIESVHVIGLTMVFGTILIVDLRLLGLASTRRAFTAIVSDVLKWTWLSFAITAATGVLDFDPNSTLDQAAAALFPNDIIVISANDGSLANAIHGCREEDEHRQQRRQHEAQPIPPLVREEWEVQREVGDRKSVV